MKDDFIKVAVPQVGEEEVAAVREVFLSGNYVSGAKVEEFEKKFAEYIGVKHAVAVNSGTAALHIALQAIGIGKGDEVIVPPLTFFATVSAVLYLGAKPVFADIDLDDFCLSPESTEKHITPATKAILPVHLFGNAVKMDEFLKLSEKHDIPLVEDCAQAHGTEFDGRKVGGFGKAGCFSFFATKHMTTGEGGMITTNDHDLSDKARIIRNHGMQGRDSHVLLGFNNRMAEMEAAMGLVQLKRLDELNQKRIAHSEYLLGKLAEIPWAITPRRNSRIKHTYFWCPLMVNQDKAGKSFDDLTQHLKDNRIGFRQRYNEPLYRQQVLYEQGHDYSGISLPNVEKVVGRVLGLPNHPALTKDDLERIVKALNLF